MFTEIQAFFAGIIIIAATVLVAMGKMPSTDWQTFATWVFGIFVGGKTIQSGTAALHKAPAAPAAPVAPAVPASTSSEPAQ